MRVSCACDKERLRPESCLSRQERDDSYVENDCPNCGKTFWAIRVIEASYTTRALGDAR